MTAQHDEIERERHVGEFLRGGAVIDRRGQHASATRRESPNLFNIFSPFNFYNALNHVAFPHDHHTHFRMGKRRMSKSDGKPHPGSRTCHAMGILYLSLEDKNLLAAGVIMIGNMEIGQHAAQPGRFRQFTRIIELNLVGSASAPILPGIRRI